MGAAGPPLGVSAECADVPTTEQLADWAREHVRDGVRAGRARRGRGTRNRQVARGAPGAAAVLLRAAADGGALSRAYLVVDRPGERRRTARPGVGAARRWRPPAARRALP